MNQINKKLYFYEGHLGSIFFAENEIPSNQLDCEQCGDSDWPIDSYNTWKETYHGIVDRFSDNPNDYDTPEEKDEYYDPDYCKYDKKYICEICNMAYGPITMEDFIDIENLKNEKVLISVRLFDKNHCREDEIDGVFAGYFVIENGKYKFKSEVDTEEWDDMWNTPIKWFESYSKGKGFETAKQNGMDKFYSICFEL